MCYEKIRRNEGHKGFIRSIAFSPSGGLLASSMQEITYILGSDDNDIILWDVKTGNQVRKLEGHTNWVRFVTFTHTGEFLISCRRLIIFLF